MGTNATQSLGAVIGSNPAATVQHQLPTVPQSFTDHSAEVSVFEFLSGPGGTGVTGNGTVDDTPAVQAAINALSGTGKSLFFPGAGNYFINTANLTNAGGVPLIFGPGAVASGANAASLNALWSPALGPASVSINVAAGGTFTLTAAQASAETIILTGSLAGSVTVVFPAYVGHVWNIDATGVTLNANTITAKANGNNWATTIGVTNLYQVTYGGTAGKLYGTSITP